MPDNPTTALVKAANSPALARVSNQLALTEKLLAKPEEPFLIPYRKGKKWGFCDRNKNIVIDCTWNGVEEVSAPGYWIVSNEWETIDEETGEVQSAKYLIGRNGDIVCGPFYSIHGINEKYPCYNYKEEWYTCDSDFRVIFGPKKYSMKISNSVFLINGFTEGVTSFVRSGNDSILHRIMWKKYDETFYDVGSFCEGLAYFAIRNELENLKDSRYEFLVGFIDYEGKVVIEPTYYLHSFEIIEENRSNYYSFDCYKFKNGFCTVWDGKKWGMINKVGKLIIPCKFDNITVSKANFFIAERTESDVNYVSVYDHDGNKVDVPLAPIWPDDKYKYVWPHYEYNDLVIGVEDGKWGYMDEKFNVVIEPQYEYASVFSDGLARVTSDGRSGYINKKGDVVIEFQFDDASIFSYGLATVKVDDKVGFIDKNGKFIIDCKYKSDYGHFDSIYGLQCGYPRFSKKGLAKVGFGLGYIDRNGTEYWED